MKPSKKQNNSESNKKENIEAYFKIAPKTFAIDNKPEKEFDATKAFYINALKKKLQDFGVEGDTNKDDLSQQVDVGDCAVVVQKEVSNDITCDKPPIINVENDPKRSTECNGCSQYAVAFKELETKYKELKARYMRLTMHFSELDMKHKHLLQAVVSTDQPNIDDVATSNDDIFTGKELKFLQSMPLDKKNDSSFILKSLEFAYKTNPSVLLFKTLKGKPEWVEITEEGEETHHVGKAPLTPKKVERIRAIFIERVSKCKIDSVDYGDRMKESYVNKLFAWGITNISKKQE